MIPGDLKYTKEHEWIRVEGAKAVIGITDYAQHALGDVIFVELPEVGRELAAGQVLGVVESVKAVSDIYAPCSGKVIAINEALLNTPELVNQDPYGDGWMVEMDVKELSEELLSAEEYEAFLAEEAKKPMPYLPHTGPEEQAMLDTLGIKNTDELFADIPARLRLNRELDLPPGLDEKSVWDHVTKLAAANSNAQQYICFRGAGAYQHYQPKAVRHIISRSEFYTAYTPYQPEISQGTLQAIFEYQTMICELTGMDIANASHYDGATALAEGALITAEATRRKKILVSSLVHPDYRETLQTYFSRRGLEIVLLPHAGGLTDKDGYLALLKDDVAGVVIQNPNFLGSVEDLAFFAQTAHDKGAMLVACVDPVTLGVLESPGALGADIAVGDGQSLGLPLSYGGPYVGFMAVKEKHLRRLPGRIVGKTLDRQGREGFVLTLQAREQHIRREKASSNICSNQALCALAVTVYLSLLGPGGLRQVGEQCLAKSSYAIEVLSKLPGVKVAFAAPTLKEFVLQTEEDPESINRRLWQAGILGGLDLGQFYPELSKHILLCVTEMRTKDEIDKLARVWGER